MKKYLPFIKLFSAALILVVVVNYVDLFAARPSGGYPNGQIFVWNTGDSINSRIGSVLIGNSSLLPTNGTKLDIFGSLYTKGVTSEGNTSITGNLSTKSLSISAITSTTTPQKVCLSSAGQLGLCAPVTPSLCQDSAANNYGQPLPCTYSSVPSSGSWVRDIAGSYTFSTAANIPSGVTSYTIEIWGGGGGGGDTSFDPGPAGTYGTLGTLPCGRYTGDLCAGTTSISGSGVSMTATGGDVGRGGHSASPATGGLGSGGSINSNGQPGGLRTSTTTVVNANNGMLCVGGIGGRGGGPENGAGPSAPKLGPNSGLGGLGGSNTTDTSHQYDIVPPYFGFKALSGGNYGGGGGGAGSVKNVSPSCTGNLFAAGGGAGGGYSKKTVNLGSPVTYSITVGQPGKGRGDGADGGKGAIKISW